MKIRRPLYTVAVPVVALSLAGNLRASIISTFDAGAEGWNHAAGGDPGTTVTWSATGGDPSGRLVLTDAAGGEKDYFQSTTKFTGNDSAYYGGVLSFDILDTKTANITTNSVQIIGAAGTLALDFGSFNANAWKTFSIPLNETAGWKFADSVTGVAPTQAQFEAILSDVTSLWIRGDLSSQVDVTSLDNVTFTVPEPAAMSTLAVGMIALSRRRR